MSDTDYTLSIDTDGMFRYGGYIIFRLRSIILLCTGNTITRPLLGSQLTLSLSLPALLRYHLYLHVPCVTIYTKIRTNLNRHIVVDRIDFFDTLHRLRRRNSKFLNLKCACHSMSLFSFVFLLYYCVYPRHYR